MFSKSQFLALRSLIRGRNVVLLGKEGSGKSSVLQTYHDSLGNYRLSNYLAYHLHGQLVLPNNTERPLYLATNLLSARCVRYTDSVLRQKFTKDKPFGGVQVALSIVIDSDKEEVPEFEKELGVDVFLL